MMSSSFPIRLTLSVMRGVPSIYLGYRRDVNDDLIASEANYG